jgi:hypothetical protein
MVERDRARKTVQDRKSRASVEGLLAALLATRSSAHENATGDLDPFSDEGAPIPARRNVA